jgi:tetratricopeptide (TPR) repeat protein
MAIILTFVPVRQTLLGVIVFIAVAGLHCSIQAQSNVDPIAEAELQQGIALTRSGEFEKAIPHLLAARGRVRNDYAARFNLSLCYAATAQYESATELLVQLRSDGYSNGDVLNLLTQSLLGGRQPEKAWTVFQEAVRLTPKNEKLYVMIAEASMDSGYYDLGRQVVETGLRSLPRSSRLVFEHAMLLSHLDFLDEAKRELRRVSELARGSDIAYIAAAQRHIFEGNVREAVRAAREGVEKGNRHFMLLTLYGEAVLSSGAGPGSKEFAEARIALEQAVDDRPAYASAHLALGRLYLLEGRLEEAISHLNRAREIDPGNPAAYSNLATALRKRGDAAGAEEMLAVLTRLNLEEIERIRSAPGDRKASYGVKPRPAQD